MYLIIIMFLAIVLIIGIFCVTVVCRDIVIEERERRRNAAAQKPVAVTEEVAPEAAEPEQTTVTEEVAAEAAEPEQVTATEEVAAEAAEPEKVTANEEVAPEVVEPEQATATEEVAPEVAEPEQVTANEEVAAEAAEPEPAKVSEAADEDTEYLDVKVRYTDMIGRVKESENADYSEEKSYKKVSSVKVSHGYVVYELNINV